MVKFKGFWNVMKRDFLTSELHNPFIGLPAERTTYDEIVDLFARGASSAEVLAFRPSEETQERVRELLERNAADELTVEEAAELERFGELEHLMQLVKARAQEYLKNKT
jgi:methylase of polypeptide subunit release factors